MVRIRLKRMGRRNRPFYRVNAIEKREKRDGKVLENLGWYDPVATDKAKQYSLKEERIKYWLGQGAIPSDTVKDLLARESIVDADAWTALRRRNNSKRYAETLEAAKAAEVAAKAEAEAKAKEEAEAKAKGEAEAKAAAEAAAAEASSEDSADEAPAEDADKES
jgi:small subunit ribosomal protein S16